MVLVLFAATGADDHRRLLANEGTSLDFRADDSRPDVLGSSKHMRRWPDAASKSDPRVAGWMRVSYTAPRGATLTMSTARQNDRPPTQDDPPLGDEGPGQTKARDPLIGVILAGKYEIGELLGKGAMGRVYRARQIGLDKHVAIKVLHRHLTGDARITRRFHREARAASRLAHPNSMQILDFGATEDGVLYIAMELLDGEDLQTIIDHDFPFSPRRVGALIVPVLRALEEAHRAGIIHRDLKPENVIVIADRSGQEHVKVCDFGIAKILDGEEGQSITIDGFVCGTPQYMAPEQARGDEIDHRSDIYAMGVVLYQMLCGTVPFSSENTLKTITQHVMDAPITPQRRRRDLEIPPGLEAVCLRALTKDPAERWQSASAMADALEAAVSALGKEADRTPVSIPPPEPAAEPTAEPALDTARPPHHLAPSSNRPRAPRAWLGGVAVLTLVVGFVWLVRKPVPDAATTVHQVSTELAPIAAPIPVDDHVPPAAPLEPAPETLSDDDAPSAAIEPRAPARPQARRRRDLDEPSPTRAGPAQEAETVEPSSSPYETAFEEGRRRFLGNDIPGAIRHFEDAANLMPQSAEVHKQLGRAYMRAGDVARSIAAYREYLSLAPNATDRPIIERIIAQRRP